MSGKPGADNEARSPRSTPGGKPQSLGPLPHDPLGPRTAQRGIKEEGERALIEYCSKRCLGLSLPPAPGWRSSLYATLKGGHFIVTASHELKKERINGAFAIPRPKAELALSRNPKLEFPVGPLGRQIRVVIKDLRFEPEDPLDLLVLKVEPLPERDGYLTPYDLSKCTLRPLGDDEDAIIVGYPEAYERAVRKPDRKVVLRRLSSHIHLTQRAEHDGGGLQGYDPAFHLLLRQDSKFGAMRISAKGLSGAPIWRMPRIDSADLWSPETLDVIGVQHALKLVKELLSSS